MLSLFPFSRIMLNPNHLMKLLIPSLACSLCVALHPSFNSSRFWDLLPDQPLPTAISLFQQLQSRMEKKREIVEYRERLDNTLASPHMTNYHMLKNLVQTQLLHSSKQQEFYQGEGVESLR
ncbi:uncharacterized protein LOC107616621 isoform X4 [Arachis ipaensis]|uniref:uncharacterized protein LOC107616621 isoform X4 n=1 Tax=Arachis ipaensis TaxID=130454 RepID=UPI000A2B4B73|nr:uncharacterized protein LOC107616621 isoform X4 [Arachis ipaensis]